VTASIEAYGFRQPIVVDGDGVIVVGHTRWPAAKRLGLELVTVHRAGSLPAEEARACRPMDNGAHEGSTWGQGLSAVELARPSDDGFDLDLTGFDEEEPGRMPAGGDTVGDGDPAGGGRRRARRAGRGTRRCRVEEAGPNGGAGAWGMPAESLEPPGMTPAAAFPCANFTDFSNASPRG
jgi:hypothetical protein